MDLKVELKVNSNQINHQYHKFLLLLLNLLDLLLPRHPHHHLLHHLHPLKYSLHLLILVQQYQLRQWHAGNVRSNYQLLLLKWFRQVKDDFLLVFASFDFPPEKQQRMSANEAEVWNERSVTYEDNETLLSFPFIPFESPSDRMEPIGTLLISADGRERVR